MNSGLFPDFRKQSCNIVVERGMHRVRRNLGQWHEYEVAQVHERVGDGEPFALNHGVAVEEYVDIDEAVVVVAAGGFHRAAQFALNPLGGVEQLGRCQLRVKGHDAVEKAVVALKAPRLGLQE